MPRRARTVRQRPPEYLALRTGYLFVVCMMICSTGIHSVCTCSFGPGHWASSLQREIGCAPRSGRGLQRLTALCAPVLSWNSSSLFLLIRMSLNSTHCSTKTLQFWTASMKCGVDGASIRGAEAPKGVGCCTPEIEGHPVDRMILTTLRIQVGPN